MVVLVGISYGYHRHISYVYLDLSADSNRARPSTTGYSFTDTNTGRTIAVELRKRVTPVNPVVARNEIEPLLSELIRQLSVEGRATEQAIYRRIRKSLCDASNACELSRSFTDLSTMAQVRPNESGDASVLLARILEKAGILVLPVETPLVH